MHNNRIGIITLPTITNYGGILQAFALYSVLYRMGFASEVIEKRLYPRQLSYIERIILYPYRFIKKRFLHKKCRIKAEELQYKEAISRYEAASLTKLFVEQHIPHRYIYDFSEIKKDDYFALVVGSDQVWRPKYLKYYRMSLNDVFLGFTRGWNIKRVSYAASFGASEWEYDTHQTDLCKHLLKEFDAVSCRETSGASFCKIHLCYPSAITVLDPTMLLSKNDYDSLIVDYNDNTIRGELMYYVLDKNEDTARILSIVRSTLRLEPFEVLAKTTNKDAPYPDKIRPRVESWIKGFQMAKFVVTDSFHACVFSIIYRKPFLVYANKDRGVARYKSLLNMFGLDYRMVSDSNENTILSVIKAPYIVDSSILSKQRRKAIEFLKDSLLNNDAFSFSRFNR